MDKNNSNLCIITRKLPEPAGSPSRHVAVSLEMYAELLALAQQTGRSMRYIASKLLKYGLANVEIVDEEPI